MPDATNPNQNQLTLHQTVPVGFPLKGVSDAWGRETQPQGTTPDSLNVVPFDLTLRGRGGTRCGTTNTLGGSLYGAGGTGHTFVQGMLSVIGEVVEHVSGGGAEQYTAVRYQGLIVFAGGRLYFGTSTASALTEYPHSGLESALDRTHPVQAAAVGGIVYIGQPGRTGWGFDPATPTEYSDMDPSGHSPLLRGPRCVVAWRNRLVCAALSDGDPQNVYFSRAGYAGDWDYGQADAAAAFVINNATKSGQIGDPVTALVPMNDNQLLIGADRALWLVDGDPADGGRAAVLNDGVGIVGPNAWCMSELGDVYFVGAVGLCRLNRGSLAVDNLSSGSYASYFTNVTGTGYTWTLTWDADRHGCWIFRTSSTPGTTNTHLWWDGRTEGLFPVRVPAGFGPTASTVFDDVDGTGRKVLFGGWAGNAGGTAGAHVYRFADNVISDDGNAIDSYAYLGPVRPFGALQQAKVTSVDVTLGEAPSGLASNNVAGTLTLQSGNSAAEALSAPRQSGTSALSGPGRQATVHVRQSATDFFLKVENAAAGKVWSLEEALLRAVPAGRARA